MLSVQHQCCHPLFCLTTIVTSQTALHLPLQVPGCVPVRQQPALAGPGESWAVPAASKPNLHQHAALVLRLSPLAAQSAVQRTMAAQCCCCHQG